MAADNGAPPAARRLLKVGRFAVTRSGHEHATYCHRPRSECVFSGADCSLNFPYPRRRWFKGGLSKSVVSLYCRSEFQSDDDIANLVGRSLLSYMYAWVCNNTGDSQVRGAGFAETPSAV